MSKFLLLLIFSLISCTKNNFDNELANFQVSLNFNSQFSLASINKKPFIIIGKNENSSLKLNIIQLKSETEINDFVKRNFLILFNQYDFKTVPYPGQITSSTECGNNFYPKIFHEKFNYVKTFANERMTYILCNSDAKAFDVYTAYFFDQKNMNLIISEFYTKDENFKINKFYQKYFNKLQNRNLEKKKGP